MGSGQVPVDSAANTPGNGSTQSIQHPLPTDKQGTHQFPPHTTSAAVTHDLESPLGPTLPIPSGAPPQPKASGSDLPQPWVIRRAAAVKRKLPQAPQSGSSSGDTASKKPCSEPNVATVSPGNDEERKHMTEQPPLPTHEEKQVCSRFPHSLQSGTSSDPSPHVSDGYTSDNEKFDTPPSSPLGTSTQPSLSPTMPSSADSFTQPTNNEQNTAGSEASVSGAKQTASEAGGQTGSEAGGSGVKQAGSEAGESEQTGSEAGGSEQTGSEAGGSGGKQTGSEAGGSGGKQTGSEAGGSGGKQTGSEAGGYGGKQTGSDAGGSGGKQTGSEAGGSSGKQTDSEAGGSEQTGSEAGGSGGKQTGSEAGGSGGKQTGSEAGGAGGKQTGSEAGGSGGKQTGFEAGGSGGKQTVSKAGGSGGKQTGSEAGKSGIEQKISESGRSEQTGSHDGGQSDSEVGGYKAQSEKASSSEANLDTAPGEDPSKGVKSPSTGPGSSGIHTVANKQNNQSNLNPPSVSDKSITQEESGQKPVLGSASKVDGSASGTNSGGTTSQQGIENKPNSQPGASGRPLTSSNTPPTSQASGGSSAVGNKNDTNDNKGSYADRVRPSEVCDS